MSRPVRRALERKPAFTADVLPKETRFSIEVVGEPDKASSILLPYLLCVFSPKWVTPRPPGLDEAVER